jgi:hypothetical protein
MIDLLLKQGMFKCLFPANSAIFIDRQTFGDEIYRKLRYLFVVANLLRIDGIDELKLVRCHPWCLPMKHFIKNESN